MSQQHTETKLPNPRRQFIAQSAAALAGTVVAPGIIVHAVAQANAPEQTVSAKTRWGMLIDTAKCANGCTECVDACNEEHGIKSNNRPQSDAQWIRKVQLKEKQTGKVTNLPMLCQHCEHPPCVDVCPTGASFRRADGIVLVDKHICIGCRYCMMACPYKARSFIHEVIEDQKPYSPRGKGTVESCNFCVKRVDEGGTPACVEACSKAGHNAMVFGDMNDPNSAIAKTLTQVSSTAVRSDLKLNPGVRYQNI
jgi:molybdopterin-containing oxidoreductase family iron-sulfur binding subunit